MEAILLNERTGTMRVFSSLNLAEAIFGIGRPITGPTDLLKRYPGDKLYVIYENCYAWCNERKPIPNTFVTPRQAWDMLDTKQVADSIWVLGRELGDRTTRIPKVQEGDGKPTSAAYVVDLRMAQAILASKKDLVKQARQLIQVLVNEGYDFYTKTEIRRVLNSPKACQTIKSRQDNWRIFRYYRPILKDLGVLITNETE